MGDNLGRERKPLLWTAIGTVLGLVLLYAATRSADPSELVATLQGTALGWAAGVLAITVGFTLIKAWRWRLLLRFLTEPNFNRLHAAIYVGLAVNFLVAHVGEVLRASSVAHSSGTSVGTVFATVVIERMLDFLAFLVLLVAVALLTPVPEFVKMAAYVAAGLSAAGFAAVGMVLWTPNWMNRPLAWLERTLPNRLTSWSAGQFAQLRTGMGALQNLGTMAAALLASVLQWILVMLAIACSTKAVGAPANTVAVTAVFVLIILGLMLPNSPLQIGPTQLAFTIGLGNSSVVSTDALAASLVYTLFLIVPIMVIGGACLMWGRRYAGLGSQ